MFTPRSPRILLVVVVAALVVTAGCSGFDGNPASPHTTNTSTTDSSTPRPDQPGTVGATTTTVETITGALPYRLEIANNLKRNLTITVTYATNGSTAFSQTYEPSTNVSLTNELDSSIAYEIRIQTGDQQLWTETLDRGEGYRLTITEWGRVQVNAHVTTD